MQRISAVVQRELKRQGMPKKREMVTIPDVALVYTEDGKWERPREKQDPLLSRARTFKRMLPSAKRTAEMAPTNDTMTPTSILTPLVDTDMSSNEDMREDAASVSLSMSPYPTPPQPIWHNNLLSTRPICHDNLPSTRPTKPQPATCPSQSMPDRPPDVCHFTSGKCLDRRHRRRPGQRTRFQKPSPSMNPPPSIEMEVDGRTELSKVPSAPPSDASHQSNALTCSSTANVFSTGSNSELWTAPSPLPSDASHQSNALVLSNTESSSALWTAPSVPPSPLPSDASHQSNALSCSSTANVFSIGSSSKTHRMLNRQRPIVASGTSRSSSTPPPSTLPTVAEEPLSNETPLPRWCGVDPEDKESSSEDEEAANYRSNWFLPVYPSVTSPSEYATKKPRVKHKAKRRP